MSKFTCEFIDPKIPWSIMMIRSTCCGKTVRSGTPRILNKWSNVRFVAEFLIRFRHAFLVLENTLHRFDFEGSQFRPQAGDAILYEKLIKWMLCEFFELFARCTRFVTAQLPPRESQLASRIFKFILSQRNSKRPYGWVPLWKIWLDIWNRFKQNDSVYWRWWIQSLTTATLNWSCLWWCVRFHTV